MARNHYGRYRWRATKTLGPDDPDCDVPLINAPDIPGLAVEFDDDVWPGIVAANDLRVELSPPKFARFKMSERVFMDRVTAGTDFSEEPFQDRWHFNAVMRENHTHIITVVLRRRRVLGPKAEAYARAFYERRRRGQRSWRLKQWEEQNLRLPR